MLKLQDVKVGESDAWRDLERIFLTSSGSIGLAEAALGEGTGARLHKLSVKDIKYVRPSFFSMNGPDAELLFLSCVAFRYDTCEHCEERLKMKSRPSLLKIDDGVLGSACFCLGGNWEKAFLIFKTLVYCTFLEGTIYLCNLLQIQFLKLLSTLSL